MINETGTKKNVLLRKSAFNYFDFSEIFTAL